MRKPIVYLTLLLTLVVLAAMPLALAQDDTGATATATPRPTPTAIADTAKEALPVGAGVIENGLVYPASGWINVRPQPTGYPGEVLGEDVVARLYWGDVVEVLDDAAQCVDGYTWYKVRLLQRGDGTPVDPRPEGWVAAKVQTKTKTGDVETIVVRANPCCSAIVTAGGGIYLRDGPGDNFNLIRPAIANYGTTNFYKFTVTAQTPNWVHIVGAYPGIQGWTRKEYLAFENDPACQILETHGEAPPEATPIICTVKVVVEGGIWFRAEPSFAAARIGSFLPGAVLRPLEKRQEGENAWWRVQNGGLEGWVLADGTFYEFSGNCAGVQ
ncbi:MAG: SH3 domain-containing protein [Anaerolineae bacterium]|nr:SH3 domain-containing protein [Anaerolineae bacterium]